MCEDSGLYVAPSAQMPVSTGVSTQFRGDVFFWQLLQAGTVPGGRADRLGVQLVEFVRASG